MSLSDELEKLASLRAQGVLTDAEFEKAKARLLDASSSAPRDDADTEASSDESLGKAANRYVDFQITSRTIGLVVAAIIFIFFFLPVACSVTGGMHAIPR